MTTNSLYYFGPNDPRTSEDVNSLISATAGYLGNVVIPNLSKGHADIKYDATCEGSYATPPLLDLQSGIEISSHPLGRSCGTRGHDTNPLFEIVVAELTGNNFTPRSRASLTLSIGVTASRIQTEDGRLHVATTYIQRTSAMRSGKHQTGDVKLQEAYSPDTLDQLDVELSLFQQLAGGLIGVNEGAHDLLKKFGFDPSRAQSTS